MSLNKMSETFGRKPDKETFWLLLRIWEKVTRPAGRNKGREYKAFEWNQRRMKSTKPLALLEKIMVYLLPYAIFLYDSRH